MAAANTITPLKDWKYGIPGHGKPLTEQEREELLRRGWSKNPSPLVNPVLGNQLKINPNRREQLLAQSSAGVQNQIYAGERLGHVSADQAKRMLANPKAFGLNDKLLNTLRANMVPQV